MGPGVFNEFWAGLAYGLGSIGGKRVMIVCIWNERGGEAVEEKTIWGFRGGLGGEKAWWGCRVYYWGRIVERAKIWGGRVGRDSPHRERNKERIVSNPESLLVRVARRANNGRKKMDLRDLPQMFFPGENVDKEMLGASVKCMSVGPFP